MTGVLLSFWLPSATGAAAASHGTKIGNQANQAGEPPFESFFRHRQSSSNVRLFLVVPWLAAAVRVALGARRCMYAAVLSRVFSQLPSKLPAAPSATRAAAASPGTKELLSLSNGKPNLEAPFGFNESFWRC